MVRKKAYMVRTILPRALEVIICSWAFAASPSGSVEPITGLRVPSKRPAEMRR
jgi:hypothetical protein